MKLQETILVKRAMLQIVEETLNNMESNKQWTVNQLETAKTSLKEFRESNPEADKNVVEYYQRDVDTYTAQLNAYDAIAKALEKLI